jgi:hypothetical protein
MKKWTWESNPWAATLSDYFLGGLLEISGDDHAKVPLPTL